MSRPYMSHHVTNIYLNLCMHYLMNNGGCAFYVITLEEIDDKWLVLKPDEINMKLFLDAICNAQQKQFTPRIRLHRYVVEVSLKHRSQSGTE